MTENDSVTLYEKPSSIENANLLDQDCRLKITLVEHFDYVVVSADIWKHLDSWYQSDHKICRRLVKD